MLPRFLLFSILAFPLFAQRYELGDATLAPAPGGRWNVRGATSNGGHLLLWEDQRTPGRTRHFAARLDANGAVLDPSGLQLGNEDEYRPRKAVASDGTDYLVLIEEQAFRIDADGTVTRLEDVPLAGELRHLVSNGSLYAVATGDRYATKSLVLLDRDARVRSGTLTLPRSCDAEPLLSAADGRWLFVAGDCRALLSAASFPPVGRTAESVVTKGRWLSALAPDGPGHISFGHASQGYGFVIQRLDAFSLPTGPELETANHNGIDLQIAGDGTSVVVAYRTSIDTGFNTRIFRIDGSGRDQQILAPGSLPSDSTVILPSPSGLLIAWIDRRAASPNGWPDGQQLYAARFASQEWLAGGTLVSRSRRHQQHPAVGGANGTALAAWSEKDGLGAAVAFQPIDADGRPLAPSTRIAVSSTDAEVDGAQVAFDGVNFLVIWKEAPPLYNRRGDIRGALVSPSGTLVEGSPFFITQVDSTNPVPSLHWSGTAYSIATRGELLRIAANGTILDRRRTFHNGPLHRNGDEWLALAFVAEGVVIGSYIPWVEWTIGRLDETYGYLWPMVSLCWRGSHLSVPGFAASGDHALLVWWDAVKNAWFTAPLQRRQPRFGVASLGLARPPRREPRFGARYGTAEVVSAEETFFVAAGINVSRHLRNGSLAALQQLPADASELRLLPLTSHEVLVLSSQAQDVGRIVAEKVVFGGRSLRR